mmetsp:Transcript_7593/g.19438  ORF Transcript_7593/g.19438 Transcript_7593/m.19438 type:complete len:232 (-) Transcript_7593:1437-2132(-)
MRRLDPRDHGHFLAPGRATWRQGATPIVLISPPVRRAAVRLDRRELHGSSTCGRQDHGAREFVARDGQDHRSRGHGTGRVGELDGRVHDHAPPSRSLMRPSEALHHIARVARCEFGTDKTPSRHARGAGEEGAAQVGRRGSHTTTTRHPTHSYDARVRNHDVHRQFHALSRRTSTPSWRSRDAPTSMLRPCSRNPKIATSCSGSLSATNSRPSLCRTRTSSRTRKRAAGTV